MGVRYQSEPRTSPPVGVMAAHQVAGATPAATNRTANQAILLSLKTLQGSMMEFSRNATCVSCHQEGIGRMATGSARGWPVASTYRLESESQ